MKLVINMNCTEMHGQQNIKSKHPVCNFTEQGILTYVSSLFSK